MPTKAPHAVSSKPHSRREPARLIVAAPDSNADMLYATRFFAPDPFLFASFQGRSAILLSDLEVDRGRKQAAVDEVLSYSDFAEKNSRTLGKKPSFADVAVCFLKFRGIRSALVPQDFGFGLAEQIRKGGVNLKPVNGPFWRERELKTGEEIKHMRRALKITAAGMARAVEILKAAETAPRNRQLRWANSTLTSERLRTEIESAILRAGGEPARTIVAGGEQACDPHERGSGPLRAGELIILDIFPRDAATGYYGDMTRTVVKGSASDAQRRLWQTVLVGQEMGLDGLLAGANGVKLHESIKMLFTQNGYPTEKRDGRWTGFFHGTGHGLGLDLHEEPRLNRSRKLAAGNVFTVEPGLYYPGLGGVRIEDVAAVSESGPPQILSAFEKRLEI